MGGKWQVSKRAERKVSERRQRRGVAGTEMQGMDNVMMEFLRRSMEHPRKESRARYVERRPREWMRPNTGRER